METGEGGRWSYVIRQCLYQLISDQGSTIEQSITVIFTPVCTAPTLQLSTV